MSKRQIRWCGAGYLETLSLALANAEEVRVYFVVRFSGCFEQPSGLELCSGCRHSYGKKNPILQHDIFMYVKHTSSMQLCAPCSVGFVTSPTIGNISQCPGKHQARLCKAQ